MVLFFLDHQQPQDNDQCAECSKNPTCVLCVECRKYYCNRCCRDHKETNYNHIVFQTQHIAGNNRNTTCETCGYRAELFCTVCWQTFCTSNSCTQNHQCGQKGIIIINQRYKLAAITELEHLYNISFHIAKNRVSICGIAFLEDDTVVIVDENNRTLIAFKSKEEKLIKNLQKKPKAITAMTGNEFAVTYPEENCIQIYNLTQNKMKNTFRMLKVNTIKIHDKPFSIAYHHGTFAIDVVEGNDGVIFIFDIYKNIMIHKIHINITLYTRHRLRLALDRNRIFVSDMDKDFVYCYDYEGSKLWCQSISGPGDIIVPEEDSFGETILLSSRTCIYELQKHNGTPKIIKARVQISLSRYMAYNSNKRTLLVAKSISNEDELSLYKFIDSEEFTQAQCATLTTTK